VADPQDAERLLARLYDPLNSDRSDLAVYAAMVTEFGARSVLDIGCGTGTLACMLAGRGIVMTAMDPSLPSLEIARAKPGAGQVRWVHGYATDLPELEVDVATMTGNAAQELVTDEGLRSMLTAAYRALRPGGRLIFETRKPEVRAWLTWNREQSFQAVEVPGIGAVRQWFEVTDVSDGLVTFRGTYIFEAGGLTLTPTSTLRFRTRDEVTAALADSGFVLDEIREAPDRPGLEMVFIAVRPAEVP
jgi:ubiquinone/menaquinone biosynthesis C-methylase UbiE